MQYAVISAGIKVQGGRVLNMKKINEIHPSSVNFEMTTSHENYHDIDALRKVYTEYLKKIDNLLYLIFVDTVLNHHNICIICCERENYYIDILVEYLKKKFALECIDLNKLFTEGRVGKIYIDRDEIHNRAVDIRRAAGDEMIEQDKMTPGGRLRLLNKMSRKQKIRKLAELGIHINESEYDQIDEMLIKEWVEDE